MINTKKTLCLLIAVALIAVALLTAFLYGYRQGRNGQEQAVITKVDTLVIRDTIKQIEPVLVEKKVVKVDTLQVTDTLTLRDTLFILLEREQIRWEDSLAVVYASGIRPAVDSVIHYTKDRIVTIETTRVVKEKSRWGLGIQAGAGMSTQGVVPYIGVGVSWNILTW